MTARIITADCRDAMREFDADSVDAIVTDPPYGLSFMGKGWDHGVPGVEFWTAALRVAKPGAHLLAFGGTRTFHRLAVAIEDAGWEIRDCVMWVYGSGFPKSLDVSKAIDRAAGAEREQVSASGGLHANRLLNDDGWGKIGAAAPTMDSATPVTDAARRWSGWGTALKPAWEPVIVARKPLTGTVAANVLQYGTGAINVDACRVGTDGGCAGAGAGPAVTCFGGGLNGTFAQPVPGLGRWPANVIHDGSDEVVALFPMQSSGELSPDNDMRPSNGWLRSTDRVKRTFESNSGSAARFFYTAKADRADRDEGLHHRTTKRSDYRPNDSEDSTLRSRLHNSVPRGNHHPTVKPVDLMRYLCRLVTPPGGTILDPFAGSGSTGKACLLEGFDFIGIELDPEYAAIARDRIYATAPLFAGADL